MTKCNYVSPRSGIACQAHHGGFHMAWNGEGVPILKRVIEEGNDESN